MNLSFLKNINFNDLIAKAVATHKRFPFALVFSLLSTILIVIAIDKQKTDNRILELILTTILGLPLLLSAELFGERNHKWKWVAIIGALLFLAGFYYFFDVENEYKEYWRYKLTYGVLFVVFHLLVSVSAFINAGTINEFWHFNKAVFLSILTAFLYTAVLSGGLCLAILAIDRLFEIDFNYRWYTYICVIANGYINTNIFLNKVPKLNELNAEEEAYPIGLKYFTQYVLLPLVAIYIMILLAYEVKIIALWSLPKGWVSVLVLACSVFGILAFLLLYPLRNHNRWVHNFSKFYYWLLIPLVGLMLAAIYVRISHYGVTEPRYYVALLAIWLLGISLYFGFSKVDNIKFIPLSLIVLGLFSVFGPFNAFQSSSINQSNRINNILSKYKAFENGQINAKMLAKLPEKEVQQLHAAIDHFAKHNLAGLQPYLSKVQFDSLAKTYEYGRTKGFYDLIKLEESISNENNYGQNYLNRVVLNVEKVYKADYVIVIDNYSKDNNFDIEGKKVKIFNNNAINKFEISVDFDSEKHVFDLSPIQKLPLGAFLPDSSFTFISENKKWSLRLLLDNVNLKRSSEVEGFYGKLYFTKK